MAYFIVQDFSSGLDVRKSPYTSANGSLQRLDDAHITRGGEIEKRKALEDHGSFPAATFGLTSGKVGDATSTSDIVFGDSPTPPVGIPAGVQYQQLAHPDGSALLTGITDYTLFEGKPFVAAEYSDGSQWVFYDGQLVTDFGAGIVRASMTTNDLIAEHLRGLIDASSKYTATRTGSSITVVGPVGVDYATVTETANVSGGVNDQTLTFAELEPSIASVTATNAVAEFAVLGGSDDAGVSNYIEKIRVNVGGSFTELISSNVAFNTSPELTALDAVTAINAGTGTHGYSAATQYGKVFVYAPGADGSAANGRILEVTAKGSVILYNGSFVISGGSASAGVNKITSVKANGVEILGSSVDWTTDNATTAAAVAAQIRSYASSPKYNAHSEGEAVFCSPEKIRSDDPTSITLVATSAGDVTFEPGTAPQVVDQYPDYGDAGPPSCVEIESFLPAGGIAGDIKVGDTMELASEITLEPRSGIVSRSDRSLQQCYRILTAGGASLVCSSSAPIPVRAGGYRRPTQLMGHEVAVRRAAGSGWETIIDIVSVGYREVQNITVENACFWAGEKDGSYILHHNLKRDTEPV